MLLLLGVNRWVSGIKDGVLDAITVAGTSTSSEVMPMSSRKDFQQGRRHRAHRAEDKTERAYLILARELVKGDVTLRLRDGKNNPVWS